MLLYSLCPFPPLQHCGNTSTPMALCLSMFASKMPLLLELNKHHLSVVMRDALAFSIELKAITHHYFYSVLKLFGVIQHESD